MSHNNNPPEPLKSAGPITLAITCAAGVESLVKREIKRIGYTYAEVYDRIVYLHGDIASIARMNLWSRLGNRVHYEVARFGAGDFDSLYAGVRSIGWREYLPEGTRIMVDAVSIHATLDSIPAIQRTGKKAIVESLLGGGFGTVPEWESAPEYHILLMIRDDVCSVLLDTSGAPLHKRGYRRDTPVDAPLKESLAASLVLLSEWSGETPLYDVCAGSGTIAIEAAYIARNRAPGLLRDFAFETFPWYDGRIVEGERARARAEIRSGTIPQIYASDRDETALRSARECALAAEVSRDIRIQYREMRDYIGDTSMTGVLVSNPPYGLRITDPYLDETYRDLARIYAAHPSLGGGILTAYSEWERAVPMDQWKKRKLYNGGERCDFFMRRAGMG